MNDLAIGRELARLLEPDETLRSEVHNREPVAYDPDMLYLWVRRSTYSDSDTGSSDRHNFECVVDWLVPQTVVDDFDPDVSALVDDKAAGIVAMVRATRSHRVAATVYWEWLQVDEIDYTSPTTTDARGLRVTLSGYVQEY